ncbi:MAG: hypothetical protein FJ279_00945 [Planctomycetes bacterium]|nr:hypothetical protein [Planctomycetota bacterium]
MRDLKRELNDWQGWPEAWRPKPGDVLTGIVESYSEGPTPYGNVHTVIVKDEDAGERVSVWLSSTVLLSEFRRLRPKPGERIGLKYEGKDADKGYHRYKLLVDRGAVPSLEALGGEDGRGEASDWPVDAPAAEAACPRCGKTKSLPILGMDGEHYCSAACARGGRKRGE